MEQKKYAKPTLTCYPMETENDNCMFGETQWDPGDGKGLKNVEETDDDDFWNGWNW